MKRLILAAALSLFAASAFADSLRSDKHLVKIDAQTLSGSSHQYSVQVFDADTRSHVTDLKVTAKGDTPAETEATANGTRYKVRIEPHGDAYLFSFTADDGTENVDTLRGGFLPPPKSRPAPQQALRGGRDVKEPKVLHRVEPAYTEEARAAHAAGTVILEVLIDRGGFVREATVVKPLGAGLDESAVEAVKQWRFEPSVQGREPVEVLQEVTIEFKP